ncbi:MAG: ATP-binding cassette domain-containing protein [Chloroflexi bacterium]|nr:ATP-binding cassette domain-containing protein [Chloroflexota bacterium]
MRVLQNESLVCFVSADVFQSHALLPTCSASENIDLILQLTGMKRKVWLARTNEVLQLIGLSKWADHRPYELSGGQQQRIAIAPAPNHHFG